MRLLRLLVKDFAAIAAADVSFGPGLNVLYGPNDLGKSTLADSIRLALLLPHTSSHVDAYVPWAGGQNPAIELTFETEAQRIWRVRKEFRKGGASFLDESRNGVDFDEVERGRKVDGRLREILRWGIPEPGGAGGSKGLPTSFLATALLSTQSDVTALLSDSLQGDPSDTGKDRIAAALQAVGQDPLFVALLRDAQARRDTAYTEKGARKTAKGSVFKDAADRLREARDEKEQLQAVVESSEGVEQLLRELTATRDQRHAIAVAAADRARSLELLATQSAALAFADEQVRIARQEVDRIEQIGLELAAAERALTMFAMDVDHADEALRGAQARLVDAEVALTAAVEAARTAEPSTSGIVVRQDLEIRRVVAEQAARDAQHQIESLLAAQELAEAAAVAAVEQRARQAEADTARATALASDAKAHAAVEQLRSLEVLERAVEFRTAEASRLSARNAVDQEVALRARLEAAAREHGALAAQRAAMIVPTGSALTPMQRLANELARARGALDVGLVVTVTPKRPVDLRVKQDRAAARTRSIAEPLEIEADTAVDLDIGDLATVRIRGGRRAAQQTMRSLEQRWEREVAPHLAAAGVQDLDALAARVEEARALDASIATQDADMRALRSQVASLAGVADTLAVASDRAKAAAAALGDTSLDALAPELAALGADPLGSVRKRRQQLSAEAEAARTNAGQAVTTQTLADERSRNATLAFDAAAAARDAALAGFPGELTALLPAARSALVTATAALTQLAAEGAALEQTIAAESSRIEAAVSAARAAVARARTALEAAQSTQAMANTDQAAQLGRLEQLRRQRDAENLPAAASRLREAQDRRATLPVPDRMVSDAEVTEARHAEARAKADLDRIVQEIQRTHGALEQVGGSVARERLRDAVEAFEAAERHEREVEAEYDAWLLLLEQMKEADAAQASHLGQSLAPAIAGRFEALTQRRYENVRLTAQLGTEGVVVSGTLRPTDRMSVGTRDQLSTLYRLALAEYLQTTVVLDDQLVQSDGARMDWFRTLLAEKARGFQIVVFTCRPGDYLAAAALAGKGKSHAKDTDGGLTRAVDLGRAIQRR